MRGGRGELGQTDGCNRGRERATKDVGIDESGVDLSIGARGCERRRGVAEGEHVSIVVVDVCQKTSVCAAHCVCVPCYRAVPVYWFTAHSVLSFDDRFLREGDRVFTSLMHQKGPQHRANGLVFTDI